MYELMLTRDERLAIDWVGNRYHNGEALYLQLWAHSEVVPDDLDWDAEGVLTFRVPEHVAWQIKENADTEDGHWPCFAEDLASKMQKFIDSII